MVVERTRDKLCIVGCSENCKDAPFDKTNEFEFWGVNNLYWTLPNVTAWTRWYEIHQITQEADGTWLRRGQPSFRNMRVDDYLKHLAALDIPVYMQKENPLVPKSIPFPFDELVDRFGKYFTNTISWEIARGIAFGFKEIHIFGVNMSADSEYHHQRPSCEYFLGIAAGLGIKIWLPDTCDLLKSRFLYAKDEPEATQFRTKLEELFKNMNEKMHIEANKVKEAERKFIQYQGALTAVQNIDKIWKNVTGG